MPELLFLVVLKTVLNTQDEHKNTGSSFTMLVAGEHFSSYFM